VGLLALGEAFTSVMTGNIELLGLSPGTAAQPLQPAPAWRLSVLSRAARSAPGRQVLRADDPAWPWTVTRALFAELALAAVFAVGWWITSSRPEGY
jgi:uncharacterized membrane protein YoaK (UPF0700 family)